MANFDASKYLDEILKDSGLAEEAQASFKDAILKNEALQKKLGETVLMRSDYSRSMDELSTQREEATKKAEEVQRYYWELKNWEEEHRNTSPNPNPSDPAPPGAEPPETVAANGNTGLTRADIEKMLKEQRNQDVGLTKYLVNLAGQHQVEFSEALDVDALEKLALEKGSIKDGYDAMVGQRRHQRNEEDLTKKLEAAREEGRKEALSGVKIPVDTRPNEPHPWRTFGDAGKTTADRASAAGAAFREALSKPQ